MTMPAIFCIRFSETWNETNTEQLMFSARRDVWMRAVALQRPLPDDAPLRVDRRVNGEDRY
jgi:hypothetical protein